MGPGIQQAAIGVALPFTSQGGWKRGQQMGHPPCHRIARVHHEGLRDQVAPGGAQYDYPERPLIGIPDALADELVDMILQRITDGK